jgi:hypothetical protein
MNHSLLLLDKVVLTRLLVQSGDILPEQGPNGSDDEIKVKFECQSHKTEKQVRVPLRLRVRRFPKRMSPQQIEVDLFAYFSFSEGTSDEMVNKFVPNVCVAHSVSYARHIIAQATALAPGGSYWLPLLNVTQSDGESAKTEEVDNDVD